MRKLAIAVCYYYAEKEYLHNEACIPIQVGYNETHIEMGIQKDNEGDNRGNRHPYYSELSGLYWLWKNIDAEYKGLFHHRRALTLKKESLCCKLYVLYRWLKCAVLIFFKSKGFFVVNEVWLSEAEYKKSVQDFLSIIKKKYLGEYEMLVPVPSMIWPQSNQQFFSVVVENYIFQLIGMILEEHWPEYYKFWCQTLVSRKLYHANMSIMRNSFFESYAVFIFSVLDMLEKKLIDGKYYISLSEEMAMSRKFGYIGELLTNTFILYQREKGIKIKELYITVNKNSEHWKHQ